MSALNNGNPLTSQGYSFNAAGRLGAATYGAYSANYYYLANSPLIDHIDFKNGGTVKMTTSKQYDKLNRLTQISSARYPGDPPGPSAFTFNYQYNSANQRTRVDVGDGTYWIYLYDKLGQVISGKRYWSEGTPVPGQQFEHAFDDIGNRTSTKAGGDSSGAGFRPANYSANYLNQYTSRDVPGTNDIIGIANATWPVTVSGQTTYRHGEYFQKPLAITNSTAAAWTNITAIATNTGTGTSQSQSGHEFLPKRPENFGYDLDGNLTSDGRWTYVWDGENRLIRLLASTPNGTQRLDFEYDWRGCRIHKTVWGNTNGTGNPVLEQKFLYDGWNLIAILNSQSSILQSFLWGTDLSGTVQGAGGVGGLLSMKDFTSPSPTNYFCAFDGNGNVAAVVSADSAAVVAQYEYDAFGKTIRVTGLMANINPLRFSTKYLDNETEEIYYGKRYLNTSTGRWITRDPLGEAGGQNLSVFVRNNGLDAHDPIGLFGEPFVPIGEFPQAGAALDAFLKDMRAHGIMIMKGAKPGVRFEAVKAVELLGKGLNSLAEAGVHAIAEHVYDKIGEALEEKVIRIRNCKELNDWRADLMPRKSPKNMDPETESHNIDPETGLDKTKWIFLKEVRRFQPVEGGEEFILSYWARYFLLDKCHWGAARWVLDKGTHNLRMVVIFDNNEKKCVVTVPSL